MAKDEKTKITIEFDTEKHAALRIYLTQKGLDLESEMTKMMNNLYEKNVPSLVKDFISRKGDDIHKILE